MGVDYRQSSGSNTGSVRRVSLGSLGPVISGAGLGRSNLAILRRGLKELSLNAPSSARVQPARAQVRKSRPKYIRF